VSLAIVVAGHLVRYPLGGHSWVHLQYLIGLQRLGHVVTFFENYGWANSCYDPARDVMTRDPTYGVGYLRRLLQPHGLDGRWCYLAEDGTAHGMPRERLAEACRAADLYINLGNVNAIPETAECPRRVLVDMDPVFTQIGGFGLRDPFGDYDARFTYGENVHRPGCEMPTGGARWLPTRQPVVLDLWSAGPGNPSAAFTSVINWEAYGGRERDGRYYGQKDREFEPFFSLPREVGEPMELAANAPARVRERLVRGGWRLADPRQVTRDPCTYQHYLGGSRAEFCVAKHAYVSTRSGWFSDRTAAYLAMGRPAIVEDTGFSDFLPCGEGLLVYRTPAEARGAIRRLRDGYEGHCRAARLVVEKFFDARRVLTELLERSV
jgi:hypothetical protein